MFFPNCETDQVKESKYLRNFLEAAQDGQHIYRKQDGVRVEIPKLMIHDRGIYAIVVRNDVLPPALEVFKSYLENEVFGLQFLDGPDFGRVMKFAKMYNVRKLKTMCTLEEIRRYEDFGDWDEYVEHVEGNTYYTPCHFDKVYALPPGLEPNKL